MIAILFVFALLAIFGQWERAHRSETETATIIPSAQSSPSPSPEESGY
jgi:hypothetical protein